MPLYCAEKDVYGDSTQKNCAVFSEYPQAILAKRKAFLYGLSKRKEKLSMALDDKDIFMAIFNKFSDQPIEFVMAQYEKAKILNMEIERRRSQLPEAEALSPASALSAADSLMAAEAQAEAPKKKKLTRRDLIINPEEAITDDSVKCCLCGKEGSSLTSRHLAQHGISVEEYKKLCGYAENQKLMSRNFEQKMLHNVQRAQQVRMDKRKEQGEAASSGQDA